MKNCNLPVIPFFFMKKHAQLEYWLRGPVSGISALWQPAAQNFAGSVVLQAREEVNVLVAGFAAENLWVRPGAAASEGIPGTDRVDELEIGGVADMGSGGIIDTESRGGNTK